jgi:hypothetical protein
VSANHSLPATLQTHRAFIHVEQQFLYGTLSFNENIPQSYLLLRNGKVAVAQGQGCRCAAVTLPLCSGKWKYPFRTGKTLCISARLCQLLFLSRKIYLVIKPQ